MPRGTNSQMAEQQASQGNARDLHTYACLIYVRSCLGQYGTLKIMAFLSTATAYYEVSVRQASALPAASFRFHLAMDTLAVRLTVPLTGPVVDFHHQVIQPPPREVGTAPIKALRAMLGAPQTKKGHPIQGSLFYLALDNDLLSHGETPHYHRRCIVSLLSSGWDQVVPMLYGRQAIRLSGGC